MDGKERGIEKGGAFVYNLKKELEALFYKYGFLSVQVYKKDKGLFLKAKK